MFLNSSIKLNKLYGIVEKYLPKNFRFLQDRLRKRHVQAGHIQNARGPQVGSIYDEQVP